MHEKKMNNIIETCCPTVVEMIEKEYPELVSCLAPVASPMIVHGRMLKKKYPNAKIVFLSPCIAKQHEVMDERFSDAVDAVISMPDMDEWIMNSNESISYEMDEEENIARIYPISGGIIKTIDDFNGYKSLAVDGIRRCRAVLESIKNGHLNGYFFELNACEGGCLGGPYLLAYKDNEWLDDDYRKTLEGYRETDPYYYQVYCLGQWGVIGKTIFDARKVNERMAQLDGAVKTGFFSYDTYYNATHNEVMIRDESIRWVDEDGGYISIYEDRIMGHPYVIGGDTAGEGSDYFVGQVLDNTNGRQVCTLRHQMDEDLYAKQMYCLGIYYNAALISIEANFSSYPVRELQRLRYPRQYVRTAEDTYTRKPKQSFGFRTTPVTRPVIIAGLVEIVRESVDLLNDADTLGEMLTFVRNEKGRAEAEEGAHDDCVMALAIAYYSRDQQSYTVQALPGKKVRWHPSMWEDYYNATAEEREYLVRKWGEPQRE